MKSSSSQLDLDHSKSVVFFLFDLTQCKFYYAGGSANFNGYQSAALLTREFQCLKKILHPDDLNYLLEVYRTFNKDSKQPGFNKKTHFRWSAEIRILTESKCWNWVEVSFDVLSYNDDHSIDKMFCTLKEKSEPTDFVSPGIRKVLGDREIQVLRLIANGNSDRQIATRLGISVHTSVRHRKNLIEKFKVKNTAELIKDASKVFWL